MFSRPTKQLFLAILFVFAIPIQSGSADKIDWEYNMRMAGVAATFQKYAVAMQHVDAAIRALKNDHQNDTRRVTSHRFVGNLQARRGRHDLAIEAFNRALKIIEKRERLYPPLKSETLVEKTEILTEIANSYVHTKNYASAVPYFERSLEIKKEIFGPKQTKRYLTEIMDISMSLASIEQPSTSNDIKEKALKYSNLWLETEESEWGNTHPRLRHPMKILIKTFLYLKDYKSAETFILRTLKINEKLFGIDSTKLIQNLEQHAVVLRKTGRVEQANDVTNRIERIKANN